MQGLRAIGGALMAVMISGACKEAPAEIDLVPHAQFTEQDRLTSELARFRVTLDGIDGDHPLYPMSTLPRSGNPALADVDGDAQLEVFFDVPSTLAETLPKLRVERGMVRADDALISVIGVRSTDGVEFARGRGVISLVPGTHATLPFNIAPEHRAPRVTWVFPAGGLSLMIIQTASVVAATLTRFPNTGTVNEATVRLTRVANGSEEPIIAEGIDSIPFGPLGPERPGLIRFRLAAPLTDGEYRLVIDGVQGRDGLTLDQDPGQPGAQPFEHRFDVEAGAPCDAACAASWCGHSGTVCPPGMACDTTRVPNRCFPSGCTNCLPGTLCASEWSVCMDNCALIADPFSACPLDRPVCDPRGVCAAQTP